MAAPQNGTALVYYFDGRNDDHLWARSYDRELSIENLFAIQSDLASQIARSLEAELSPEQTRRIPGQLASG